MTLRMHACMHARFAFPNPGIPLRWRLRRRLCLAEPRAALCWKAGHCVGAAQSWSCCVGGRRGCRWRMGSTAEAPVLPCSRACCCRGAAAVPNNHTSRRGVPIEVSDRRVKLVPGPCRDCFSAPSNRGAPTRASTASEKVAAMRWQ